MAAEGGGDIIWFTYTGADGEVIEATHIIVQARVVRAWAFQCHPDVVEVSFHEGVEKIEEWAFGECYSLRRVIMRGVKVAEESAFDCCEALEDVECDELEIIGQQAFCCCESLRSINLPSARVVRGSVFANCKALTDVEFGSKLERIEEEAFENCSSLERITIPLKDGFITDDNIFRGCHNLRHVDLIGGKLDKTIASLQLEEWRNDMNIEIDSINQILPHARAGWWDDDGGDPGEKAQAIRRWIRSVFYKIIHYKYEHQSLLHEAATTLELVLPDEIVMNNVLPFLHLPPYTFEMRNDEEEEDSDDEMQLSESSLREEEEE